MKIKISVVILFGLSLTGVKAQTVKDIDGNVYKTVTIGTQIWMAENLKTQRFNDGTKIPLATLSANEWADHTVAASTTPAYCWLYDSASVYKDSYGAFYNGYTVTSGNLCPSGWHVPSDAEWTILTTWLGGENVAGGKLKEEGITHWKSPNNGATNETGFTARAGGSISDNGSNWEFGYNCNWWSSSMFETKYLWSRVINFNVSNIQKSYADRQIGYPVRCLSDVPVITGNTINNSQKEGKQSSAAKETPPELVTIRNEKYRFEVTIPKSWSYRKGLKPDPDEGMRSGDNPSFVIPGNDGNEEPKDWNGIASTSPFVHIYSNEKSDQNQDEFIKLFESTIADYNSKIVSMNRTFSVADAKGFDINYILGLNTRITGLYRNGIRVIIFYTQFPSNDTTVYKKNAMDLEEVIRSVRIK